MNLKEIVENIKNFSLQHQAISYDIEKTQREMLLKKQVLLSEKSLLEKEVMFNVELKNDKQREASLKELLNNSESYQKNQKEIFDKEIEVSELENSKNLMKIEIEFNKNLLKIAEIEAISK